MSVNMYIQTLSCVYTFLSVKITVNLIGKFYIEAPKLVNIEGKITWKMNNDILLNNHNKDHNV